MNHTTLALVAVLAAAAVIIGTFATALASPAFAEAQTATNCTAVANDGANQCRQQGTDAGTPPK